MQRLEKPLPIWYAFPRVVHCGILAGRNKAMCASSYVVERRQMRKMREICFQGRGANMHDRAIAGAFVTETFDYDGGRPVTVYVPREPPEAIIFASDGQRI